MENSLRRLVWQRANDTCEYCRMPQAFDELPFEIDHVIARKHGGETVADNLALSCYYCNAYKGPNIAGIDPDSAKTTPLFHPRREQWEEHFQWKGAEMIALTPTAGATIAVLGMNLPERVALRAELIREGVFPA